MWKSPRGRLAILAAAIAIVALPRGVAAQEKNIVEKEDRTLFMKRVEVRSTRHGPLVDSILGGEALAARWTGLEPGDGWSSMLGQIKSIAEST